MFYYFIITLNFFRSPLHIEAAMAAAAVAATAPAPVAAVTETAGEGGAAGGAQEWERSQEGRKRSQ